MWGGRFSGRRGPDVPAALPAEGRMSRAAAGWSMPVAMPAGALTGPDVLRAGCLGRMFRHMRNARGSDWSGAQARGTRLEKFAAGVVDKEKFAIGRACGWKNLFAAGTWLARRGPAMWLFGEILACGDVAFVVGVLSYFCCHFVVCATLT
jgi:hypothetical protein